MHTGFVLLNCDLGAEEYILEELQQVNEIKNAYITFGAYDIIAEIHAETHEDFENSFTQNKTIIQSRKYNDVKCNKRRMTLIQKKE